MSLSQTLQVIGSRSYAGHLLERALRGIYIGYRLCVQDIRASYSNQLFGLVWEFVEPLVLALIFIHLHRSQAITVSELAVPYGLFVVSGIMTWQSFAESLTLAMGSIHRMSGLLGNLRVTPEALMASVIFRQLFNTSFRWAVIIGTALWFGSTNGWYIALFLMAFPAIMICGLSIGFLAAPFAIVSGDLSTLIQIILRPLMFMSGALFPLPAVGVLSYFGIYNPAAVFIHNLRTLLTEGQFSMPERYFIFLGFFLLLFLGGWYVYRVCLRLVSWQA